MLTPHSRSAAAAGFNPPMSDTCCPPPGNDTGSRTEANTASAGCPPATRPADACCPPDNASGACCPTIADDRPGYKLWPFVCGWLDTPAGKAPQIATRLTINDITGRWQMRWGLGRGRYSIAPGLYAIGSPNADSHVLVTANYKMTFDLLRRDMQGHDLWLLVLDTQGINVWCAAGKGTFGTDEMIHRVQATGLDRIVNHRTLIVPQLGAPGIAAHKVSQACGFKVMFGPVRSSDLPQFLADGCHAAPQMRRVTFGIVDRLVLTPVELVNMRRQIIWSILVLLILGGVGPQFFSLSAAWSRGGAAVCSGLLGIFSGAVLVPILLPWLPWRAFAMKGAITGFVAGLLAVIVLHASLNWLNAMALLIAVTSVSSWCAMHFTGSSTFTSPSGVEKEMRQAIPAQAAALLVGGLCWLAAAFQ